MPFDDGRDNPLGSRSRFESVGDDFRPATNCTGLATTCPQFRGQDPRCIITVCISRPAYAASDSFVAGTECGHQKEGVLHSIERGVAIDISDAALDRHLWHSILRNSANFVRGGTASTVWIWRRTKHFVRGALISNRRSSGAGRFRQR